MTVYRQIRSTETEELFQNRLLNYSSDLGSVNAYHIVMYPAPELYADGFTVSIKAGSTNTGPCTFNIGNLSPVSIKKYGNQDLEAGDIKQGQIVTLTYSEGIFHLQNPASSFLGLASNIIQDSDHRFVTDADIAAWNNKQDNYGYIPENIMSKSVAGGYASLDYNGKIPLSQIPNVSGIGGTNVYIVSGSVERLALTGLKSGDGVYQYGDGDSYIYDASGSVWYKTASPEWANINISWTNIINKPAAFPPTSHSHTPSEVGLSNVTNVQQLPLSYLDIDGTLASNSDIKVPSQKAIKTYIDNYSTTGITAINNKILDVEACLQLDMKVPIGSGSYARFYDIMNNTNYYSVGVIDSTNTYLLSDLITGQVSASVQSTTGFNVGQEVTIQNITNIEKNIIASIPNASTLVFSTPVNNSYLSTYTKVYRSIVNLDTVNKRLSFPQFYGSASDTFTQLPTPATIPNNNAYTLELSSDGTYLAMSYDEFQNVGRVRIYKKDTNGNYIYLTTFTDNLRAFSLEFDPSDTYLAVGTTNYSGLYIYKRSGDIFTKLTSISIIPNAPVHGVSWSGDSTYLAIGTDAYPYLFIYKRSGDTFTKLTTIDIVPQYEVNRVSFTNDGIYLAVGLYPYVSNALLVYKRSGDTFTKLSGIPSFTWAQVIPLFSPDGKYLILKSSGVTATTYKRSGDTFTYLNNLGSFAPSSFTADSKYVAGTLSSNKAIYRIDSGDVFTYLSVPGDPPNANSSAISSTGENVAFGHVVSPYFSTYVKDLGYADATEFDLRYILRPEGNIKEILSYVTKTQVPGFVTTGSISLKNTETETELYTLLTSSVSIIGSNEEVKLYGNFGIEKKLAVLKLTFSKPSSSITGTYITKLLGITR